MKLEVNGTVREVDAPNDMPLLWVLRDLCGTTGVARGRRWTRCSAATASRGRSSPRRRCSSATPTRPTATSTPPSPATSVAAVSPDPPRVRCAPSPAKKAHPDFGILRRRRAGRALRASPRSGEERRQEHRGASPSPRGSAGRVGLDAGQRPEAGPGGARPIHRGVADVGERRLAVPDASAAAAIAPEPSRPRCRAWGVPRHPASCPRQAATRAAARNDSARALARSVHRADSVLTERRAARGEN